jgi:catalase
MPTGPRGPALLQDIWLIERTTHFDREVIPERRMHAKGWGAYGTVTVTHDITRYTGANIFGEIGKTTPLFARLSTDAGDRVAAVAERGIRRFAIKFYTEDGTWNIVGNNTPVSFVIRRSSPTSIRRSSVTGAPGRGARTTNGISGRCCPNRCTRSAFPCFESYQAACVSL